MNSEYNTAGKLVRKCTKDHPFVPPVKENEFWIHVDAYYLDPADEGRFFKCPNCGTLIDIGPDTM